MHSFLLESQALARPASRCTIGVRAGGVRQVRIPVIRPKQSTLLDIPLNSIIRPLGKTRSNDPEKVADLAKSIAEIGLLEPIDVLEVDGVYYGFSGCHRYEAHQRLGLETIRCRVLKSNKETLRAHIA